VVDIIILLFWVLLFNIKESGKIFGFGRNSDGQLGLGDKIDRSEPVEILSLKNLEIEDIFCGLSHSIAISSTFKLLNYL
jgi:alpha-tubulin suppressor-like RCC1 family protein